MTEIFIPTLTKPQYEELASALRRLVWAYCFIHLHFNLGNMDVLPDWAGYFMIYLALETLQKYSPSSGLLRNFAAALTFWNLFTWIVTFFVDEFTVPVIPLIFSLVDIYFHFQLLTNLADIAEATGCGRSRKLRTLRTFSTVLRTVLALPLDWETVSEFTVILVIVSLVSFGILIETILMLNLMKKDLQEAADHLQK